MGEQIAGRYEIVRLIARGGMGVVYEALQYPLRRAVALKILHPMVSQQDAARSAFQTRFNLEAETLARLSHPNTVTIHDYGQTDRGLWYLVMEYVEGKSLSAILADENVLAWDRAVRLMLQVCRAVRHAHRRGVIHRDLKPSNLLVKAQDDGEELVKVVDFGLVKLTTDDQNLTSDGTVLGSPHCMSPEQVRGDPIDEGTDIYALGVLLFRCIAGEYPFHGVNSTATMIAHVQQIPPHLKEIMPPGTVVPDAIDPIIQKCLSKRREDRYADVADLMRDLGALISDPSDDVSTFASIEASRPAPRRLPWIWIVVGVVVAVAGIGGLVFGLTRPPAVEPEPPAATDQPVVSSGNFARTLSLLVETSPPGATVLVEGEPIGTTPFTWEVLTSSIPDDRALVFRLDGFEEVKTRLDLAQSRGDPVQVVLSPIPNPVKTLPPAPEPKPVPTEPPPPATPVPEGYKQSPY